MALDPFVDPSAGYIDIDEKGFVAPTPGIVIEATVTDYLEISHFVPKPEIHIDFIESEETELNWEAEIILSENIENLENLENAENFENLENSENFENLENVENIENLEVVGTIEKFEIVETIENTNVSEVVNPVNVPDLIQYPDGILVVNQEQFSIIDYHSEEFNRDAGEEVDDNEQPENAAVDEKGFLGNN